MNEKERKILSFLRKDARCSASEIAATLQMPISSVYDVISKMSKEGKIRKYTVLLNFPKVDCHYHHYFILKSGSDKKARLLQFLKEQKAVNNIKEVQDGFLAETVHAEVKDYFILQEALFRQAEHTEVFQVISDISSETADFGDDV